MRISFLASTFAYPTTQTLVNNSKDLGHEVFEITPEKLDSPFSCDLLINRITGITYNDDDLSALKRWSNTRVINSIESTQNLRNKADQAKFFQNISVPTFEARNFQTKNREKQNLWVIKPERSNQGLGLEILKSTELETKLSELKTKGDLRYIIQPYIDYKTEWRFLFAGNELIATIAKSRTQNKTHNSDGSNFYRETPTKNMSKFALEIYQRSKLSFCAVDIFEYEGRFYFLEVNLVPGIEELQNHYKENLGKKIILALINIL